MGREKLLKKVKQYGVIKTIIGILSLLLSIFLIFAIMVDEFHPIVFVFVLMLISSIPLVYFGINELKPEKSKFLKENPEFLELADDLYNTTVFENDFIIISKNAIAVKNNIKKIANVNDVLIVYESINKTNGITTSHTVNMGLRNGKTYSVNVYARKRETKDDLVLTIQHYCPNSRAGYSAENMEYWRNEKAEYKMKKKQK